MKEAPWSIVTVNEENLPGHPEVICFINPRHETYSLKMDWIRRRLREGLRIKLLYVKGQKRAAGFIEYVPGENAWRAVSASGYMFIHCILVFPNRNKGQGIGTRLIRECVNDAKTHGLLGVAAVVSSGSFMAGRELFARNGFQVADTDDARNELMVRCFNKGALPRINEWESTLRKYRGLNIVYSRQCPWVARFVNEIQNTALRKELKLKITELKTPAQAQKAPSLYATFNLIYNGKLLADRYISATRFRSILREEGLVRTAPSKKQLATVRR